MKKLFAPILPVVFATLASPVTAGVPPTAANSGLAQSDAKIAPPAQQPPEDEADKRDHQDSSPK